VALACARLKALGAPSRRSGIQDSAKLVAYAAQGAHNAIAKAMELLGLGTTQLRLIAAPDGGMDIESLRQAIAEDRATGLKPFCVVATAGSVDRGAFDDMEKIAALCDMENLWMHVDGAFGAWLRLAGAPWRNLTAGIEKAHSVALDFHKFMFVPYDCGAVLIRDESVHRATFAARPDYLASGGEALAGGEPWFCDYGIELSRSFRALKVWTALRLHGQDSFGAAISDCCSHARHMAERISQTAMLRLAAPVVSNVCCFGVRAELPPDELSRLNQEIAARLQMSGEAVFSTTKIEGVTVLRAAIVNHRTTKQDAETAIAVAERETALLLQA
jgi:aromatic-L-amino-acid/L-tryptophan decarboxylase